jgi:hypothetical protein
MRWQHWACFSLLGAGLALLTGATVWAVGLPKYIGAYGPGGWVYVGLLVCAFVLLVAVVAGATSIDETPTLQEVVLTVGFFEAGGLVVLVIYLASSFTTAGWGG